jgi:hypothetical protein
MESRSVRRAHFGGSFEMVTHDGKPFTDKDLLGKWSYGGSSTLGSLTAQTYVQKSWTR